MVGAGGGREGVAQAGEARACPGDVGVAVPGGGRGVGVGVGDRAGGGGVGEEKPQAELADGAVVEAWLDRAPARLARGYREGRPG